MNYRSIGDLSSAIRDNLYKIPRDIDLVVGIPRSGMLAATIIALHGNLKFTDIDAYLADRPLEHGSTRSTRTHQLERPSDASHVLFVDDTVCTGLTIQNVRQRVAGYFNHRFTFAAIYAAPNSTHLVDVFLEIVKLPRVFEWNLFHRPALIKWCLDIDGVLCVDPAVEESDDGAAYRGSLLNASALSIPSYPVGHLVTSRLEKYRKETQLWLENHGVAYHKLHMLDLPDAERRRKLGCHSSFKAQIYRNLRDSTLFVESDPHQAIAIANQSGKQVLCYKNQELYSPDFSYSLVEQETRTLTKRVIVKLRRIVRGNSAAS